jgi:glycosyltransferase involved in cell wall biosynthesis
MRDALARDNVVFIGHKSKEELRGYYRAADVFVLMTRGDAWGLVVNEAMSCGLPVITTDKCVAGHELVENDVNGFLIDSESWRKCADSLKMLFENDDMCKKMGLNSLKKIRLYTIEEMVLVHLAELEE